MSICYSPDNDHCVLVQYSVQGSCCTGLTKCVNRFADASRLTLGVESLGMLIKVNHLPSNQKLSTKINKN